MTNLSKTIAFLSLLLIVLKVKAKKSCISTCSESSFPHCGSWIAYDNAKDAAGVYLRNFGFVNLTCSVNSLPKPVTIKWMFRASGASTAQETTCASARTVTECKFNDVESENDPTASPTVSIQVHGIQNITASSEQSFNYGDSGSVSARICATPKPDVVWVNTRTGITVLAGYSNGNYTALPLQPVSLPSGEYAKAEALPYCYDAVLIVGSVTATDNRFKAIVRSGMFTEEKIVPVWIANLPRSQAVDRFNNAAFIKLLCIWMMLIVTRGAL